MNKRILAFDFGASSGRAIIGTFNGKTIELEEVHRFSNDPVMLGDTFYWDVLRLFHEIKQGLVKARLAGGFDAIGIDTWGVDFGLLDKDGRLLENPVHYRDLRTDGMIQKTFETVPADELYKETGLQFMSYNTLFQLVSLKEKRPELLERADKFLFMPDLFVYFLTGNKKSEYSIASTSQLVSPYTHDWNRELIRRMGFSENLFSPLVDSGTSAGTLRKELCEELDLPPVEVMYVTGHDTASAVASVPAKKGDEFVYISSGTWSLMGIESDAPIINEKSAKYNYTNEGGINRTTRFLCNIMGLWLIQESRRQWIREGQELSFNDMEKAALASPAFQSFIDPTADVFMTPGNMPERIREFCRKTGQHVPETVGEVVRCIYESLALKYRETFKNIEEIAGKKYGVLHIVGGGTKDGLLSQFSANACGVPVVCGPIEATAMGNIAVNLIGSGDIKDVWEAREVISASFETKNYEPKDTDAWEKAAVEFAKVQGK